MAESLLGQSITFLETIGVYDVVLPFILVFVILFALLERTKIFGTEKLDIDGKTRDLTKKNLNSMAAFVIAFFVVASSRMVEIVTSVSAQMVILLLLVTFLLLLVGSFYKAGSVGENGLENKYIKGSFLTIVSLGIVLIFLNSIKTAAGEPWLAWILRTIARYWDTAAFATLVFIALLIWFVWFVAGTEEKSGSTEGGSK